MNPLLVERCKSYLLSHTAANDDGVNVKQTLHPVITISRETGAGGTTISQLLIEYIKSRKGADPDNPWALFDRNLIQHVLARHHLSSRLQKYMPEDVVAPVNDLVEDLLGLHPDSSQLVQHVNETIKSLASTGNVVLIGRGANLVTARLKHAFHVRLVASMETRITRIAMANHLDYNEAVEFIHRNDKARRRYVWRNFHHQIDDPQQYHMVINTSLVSFGGAARAIGGAVIGMGLDGGS